MISYKKIRVRLSNFFNSHLLFQLIYISLKYNEMYYIIILELHDDLFF